MPLTVFTDPEEFKRFHQLLTRGKPGYQPYYFPLEKSGKDPLPGVSWKNNRKTFSEAYELMKQGFNIGIAGTDKDNLCIVDVDNLEAVGETKTTLTVKSRKQIGRHCFYFTNDEPAQGEGAIFKDSAKQNIATEDAGEVRANWQYVVAAGSFVPCSEEEINRIPEEDREHAGKYRIHLASDVSDITFNELPEVYIKVIEEKRERAILAQLKPKIKQFSQYQDKDSKYKSALWNLDIHDVTRKPNNPNHRFPSPFHGSKTFKDTSVSGDLLHCWRHNCSHNAITYLAVEAGISTCSRAGFPHGGGNSDVDKEDPETVFTIWKYAKDNGYIPKDDPIPATAMRYYAKKNGIHDCNDLEDGWKLPTEAYNKVIEECEKEGIETGRKPLDKKRGLRGAAKKLVSGLSVTDIVEGLQEEVPIYFDNGKNFWMWNHDLCVYQRIDETEIMCQITEHLDLTIYSKDFKNLVLEGIRQTGRLRRVKPTKQEWIQFKNGVFDIETGKIFTATPDYFFVSQIPHNLGDSEETPILDKLFNDWQSDKAKLLEEICAYSLLDSYPIQRIFAFIGPGGNGKGQFTTFVKRLLGVENCVGTDLDRLSDSRFEASKLFKKKAAFVGETNYTLSKTSLLKSLTGGDTISGEFKGKDPFDFVNTAKIFISTNGLPVTTDRSEGFYRRWCLIEFKNKFKDGKDIINTVPEIEYQNFCRKSIRLLRDIINNGKLQHEPEQSDRKEQYEKLSNPIQAFINDECKVSDELFAPVWYLYEQYNIYREAKGHRYILQNEFAKIVEGMGYNRKQKWFNGKEVASFKNTLETEDGKNWMAFEGIGLDSRGNSRGGLDDENTETDNEKNKNLEDSSHSIGKTQSDSYIHSNYILPLDSLEMGKKGGEKEYTDSVLTNCLNTSRNASRNTAFCGFEEEVNNLSSCELMRTDLKNFARSRYNLTVDNLPVFVGEFNKEFPGYKQKYGQRAVLDNAERLSSRGWK